MTTSTKPNFVLTVLKEQQDGYPGKLEYVLCASDGSVPPLTDPEDISRALTSTTNESHYYGVCRTFGTLEQTPVRSYEVDTLHFYRGDSEVIVEVLNPHVNLDCKDIVNTWLNNAAKVREAFSKKYPAFKVSSSVAFNMDRLQDTIYG